MSSADLSPRDFHILEYAEYLYCDHALWHITIEYMYSCGDAGKSRADQILERVPLRLFQRTTDQSTAERLRSGDVVGVLKEVNEACHRHRRENVRRTVCKVCVPVVCRDLGLKSP